MCHYHLVHHRCPSCTKTSPPKVELVPCWNSLPPLPFFIPTFRHKPTSNSTSTSTPSSKSSSSSSHKATSSPLSKSRSSTSTSPPYSSTFSHHNAKATEANQESRLRQTKDQEQGKESSSKEGKPEKVQRHGMRCRDGRYERTEDQVWEGGVCIWCKRDKVGAMGLMSRRWRGIETVHHEGY